MICKVCFPVEVWECCGQMMSQGERGGNMRDYLKIIHYLKTKKVWQHVSS